MPPSLKAEAILRFADEGLIPYDGFKEGEVKHVAQSQSIIGWKNLLEGLLSTQWCQVQQRHYTAFRCKKSAKRWIKGLFICLHNLTSNQSNHQNDIKHRICRTHQERMNYKLNQEICKLYLSGSQDLPHTERQHFRWSIVFLLQKLNGCKRHWLKNVTAAHRRQAHCLTHNAEIDVTKYPRASLAAQVDADQLTPLAPPPC